MAGFDAKSEASVTKKNLRVIVLLAAAVLLACCIIAAGLLVFCHKSGDSRAEKTAVEAGETVDEDEADDNSGPPFSQKLKVAGQFMWADFKDWFSRKFSNKPPAPSDPF